PGRLNGYPGADRHRVEGAGYLYHQAAHADHPAVDLSRIQFVDLLGERLHEVAPKGATRPLPLTSCLPASLIIASPSLGSKWSCPPGRRGESQESVTTAS